MNDDPFHAFTEWASAEDIWPMASSDSLPIMGCSPGLFGF
jgi:hypothetical protein